jgi:glycerol uptake facilitator-like aquaporin
MKKIYLYLSVVGFIVPYAFFLPFLRNSGFDVLLFFHEMFATQISAFFSWDVIISGIALILFIVVDHKRKAKKYWWVPIIGLFIAGVSFALPLYLYIREEN